MSQTPSGSPPSVRGVDDADPLRLALDDIQDYAVFMVSLDARIATWNRGAERLKGWAPEEAVGMPFEVLFTPEDRAKGQPGREMAIAREKGVYQGEGQRQRKDGSKFEAEVTLRFVRDAKGVPLGFVKITRDITERRKGERWDRERVEFEKQLLGIVSHDLRNPLNVIMVSASLLLRSDTLRPREQRILGRIVTSGERAMRLTRELLDFTQARLGGGLSVSLQTFPLEEVCREAVEEAALIHPDRKVDFEGGDLGEVTWDRDRLQQLLGNLIGNALRHGSAEKRVHLRARAKGEELLLEVHNFGTPLEKEAIPHMFERLTQGSERRDAGSGSIGLGLFIASHIVKAHRGNIEVTSTAEEGTTFRVTMPRAPQPPG